MFFACPRVWKIVAPSLIVMYKWSRCPVLVLLWSSFGWCVGSPEANTVNLAFGSSCYQLCIQTILHWLGNRLHLVKWCHIIICKIALGLHFENQICIVSLEMLSENNTTLSKLSFPMAWAWCLLVQTFWGHHMLTDLDLLESKRIFTSTVLKLALFNMLLFSSFYIGMYTFILITLHCYGSNNVFPTGYRCGRQILI
jgi:hypothetical protein